MTLGPIYKNGGGGGMGDVTTASNVGAGNGWFKQKNGTVLEFNTFEVAGGLDATLAADVWTIDGTLLLNQINDISDALSTLAGEVADLQTQIITANQYLIEYSAIALTPTTFNAPQEHLYVINGVIAQAVTLPAAPLAGDDGTKITVKNRNTAVASISVSGNGLNIDGTGIVDIPTNGSMTFVYSHATTEWFIT